MSNEYEREVQLLSMELMKDDSTLTEAEARQLARESMLALYRFALTYDQAAARQRSTPTQAA